MRAEISLCCKFFKQVSSIRVAETIQELELNHALVGVTKFLFDSDLISYIYFLFEIVFFSKVCK